MTQGDRGSSKTSTPGDLQPGFGEKHLVISVKKTCEGCGTEFEPNTRGRPRKFCSDCIPPVKSAGRAAVARAWRSIHPEYVASRRLGAREFECVDCESVFLRRSTVAVRCETCRYRRKRELDRRRVAW